VRSKSTRPPCRDKLRERTRGGVEDSGVGQIWNDILNGSRQALDRGKLA
jgi:hypothetical protein